MTFLSGRHCVMYKCTPCPWDIFPRTDAKEQVGSEIWQEGAVLCTTLSWLLSFLLLWRSSSPYAAYLALPCRAALVLVLGRVHSASRGREGVPFSWRDGTVWVCWVLGRASRT